MVNINDTSIYSDIVCMEGAELSSRAGPDGWPSRIDITVTPVTARRR